MRYTVTWLSAALDELMRLWTQAADRQAVTDAANRIDRVLAVDPERQGRPLGSQRVLVEPPLVVTFQVIPDDRMVRVLQVSRIP